MLLLRTVYHLRASQIIYQVWYRLRPTPKVVIKKRACVNPGFKPWVGHKFVKQCFFPADTFHFLNKKAQITTKGDWNNSAFDKLWLYNLHYFDDLTSIDSETRLVEHRYLVKRWISENPVMQGNGWEPYPLSLRIVNWIKWLSQNYDAGSKNSADRQIIESLHLQVLALERQLEYHILANHLFANIKALWFAGAFFDGADSERWRDKAMKLLKRELNEQFLSDGAHYERSPMYHCILTWDLLDLFCSITTHRVYNQSSESKLLKELLADKSERALGFLRRITHPDGNIAFFNDSTLGIAPRPQQIEDYGKALGLVPRKIDKDISGFARLERGDVCLLADIGEIQPVYQPGHAHAEAGAFELSIGEQRVFVNSGISEYNVNSNRLYQRGAASHNCAVVVNNSNESVNSSEVWSGFRVGRRARIKGIVEHSSLVCETEGFFSSERVRNKPAQMSRKIYLGERDLKIVDTVCGNQNGRAFFHLHPDCDVEQIDINHFEIVGAVKTFSFKVQGCDKVVLGKSNWSPEFGIVQQRIVIRIDFTGQSVSRIIL